MQNHRHNLFALFAFAVLPLGLALADNTASDSRLRRKATTPIKDVTGLPRILLIGDSITMGYTLPLRDLLNGKANVHFPHENCHTSQQIVEQLDTYLGDKPWDVIQFNCGIHDITMLNEAGKAKKAGEQGKMRVTLDEYRSNLETIIARLQKTGASLIWCSTTPVADNLPHRNPKDIERYNEVAKKIVQKHGIPMTDLHAIIVAGGKPKWTDGVHFSVQGSRENAATVCKEIEAALAKQPASKN